MPGTAANRRVNYLNGRGTRYTVYEDGNAVRKLRQPAPQRSRQESERRAAALRARGRMAALDRGFVLFLAMICAVTTMLCVVYLQQRSQLTTITDEIGVLESRYTALKSDNDAKYNAIISSFTLEDVKDAALTRLGMHYAEADQVQYYTLDQDSYVRQYKEVRAVN